MDRKDRQQEISHDLIENGTELLLDFDKLNKISASSAKPVIPVAVQDIKSGEILIIAYVNKEALEHTIKTGNATFWSTSRNVLWEKGASSGDVLKIKDIFVNCEQNSLVYKVEMVGKGSCHVKDDEGNTRFGCYYRKLNSDNKLAFAE